jgi:hypothetical protein
MWSTRSYTQSTYDIQTDIHTYIHTCLNSIEAHGADACETVKPVVGVGAEVVERAAYDADLLAVEVEVVVGNGEAVRLLGVRG